MMWDVLLYTGQASLDTFAFGSNPEAMIKIWTEQYGATKFYRSTPSRTIEDNGLAEEDFSSDGVGGWDMFRFPKFTRQLEENTEVFVRTVVETTYEADDDVTNDPQLQAMFAALVDPAGSNLQQVTASGKLETVDDLVDMITTYLYNIVVHGAARHRDTTSLLSCAQPNLLRTLDIVQKPITYDYTDQEMLRALPSVQQTGGYTKFYNFFLQTVTYGGLYPNLNDVNADFPHTEEYLISAFVAFRQAFRSTVEAQTNDLTTAPGAKGLNNWPLSSESR